MPQILNAHDFNPDFGLANATRDDDGDATQSLLDAATRTLGLPVAEPKETAEHTDNTEGRDGSPSRPQDGVRAPGAQQDADADTDGESAASAAASSAAASASVHAPRPYPDEQMIVATAPTVTAAGGASGSPAVASAAEGTSGSPAVASATASSGITVADALDTLNYGASIANSILHIWNMVH